MSTSSGDEASLFNLVKQKAVMRMKFVISDEVQWTLIKKGSDAEEMTGRRDSTDNEVKDDWTIVQQF